jgi:hypothetical protein
MLSARAMEIGRAEEGKEGEQERQRERTITI